MEQEKKKKIIGPAKGDTGFDIELNQVPISWDMPAGNLTFFGLDSALFWTDPSLLRTLAPLAEEIGSDLFQLLVAHSSSQGTEEDYHNMVSTLGRNFQEGFLAWGRAVSGAGWGFFHLPDFDPASRTARVVVVNPWELNMQRGLEPEKRWGCPFLQGKIIGIFSHAFGAPCWAGETCDYDSHNRRVVFDIYASTKTIEKQINSLRRKRMLAREKALAEKVEKKTAELKEAQEDLKRHSLELEQLVAKRTEDLSLSNRQLHSEIATRIEAEKEVLGKIASLQQAEEIARLGYFERNWQTGKGKWSDGFYRLLGLDPGRHYEHREFMDFVHPEDKKRVADHIQRTLAEKQPMNIEFKIIDDNGLAVNIAGIAESSWDEKGRPLVTRGVFQDISKQKKAEEEKAKLEEQFHQSQKLESIGRLAGGVAHDFNNMLGVILGHAEMALDSVDEYEPLYGDLREIQNAARRSADLTRQLLAFARRQTIAPKPLNLNETIPGMLTMLQRLIGENIRLAWIPGEQLWDVMMDPSQLDQILANLCVNARDAIPNVGEVTIKTGNMIFDEDYCKENLDVTPGEFVLFSISDNGRGMDKATIENLFEPFFTTKSMAEGTGLGLATVYGIVKQNKGFIHVDSKPGRGASFKIYLPRLASSEKTGPDKARPETQRGKGETVLIVEDEVSIMNMGQKMLETLGYRVLAAASPLEALDLAKDRLEEVSLLLTDVVMPEMNGRELARRLQARNPALKTIYMSGYTADVIAHHGVLEKGMAFIQKPFSINGLASKVRQALNDS